MKRDDLLSTIDNDLANLDQKKSAAKESISEYKSFFWGALCTFVFGVALQFITNKLYDPTEHDLALKQMEEETLVVPKDFYVDRQEECIREVAEGGTLDLEDWSQDEVLGLLEDKAYEGQFNMCSDEMYINSKDTQEDYVQSLEKSTVGATIARFTLGSSIGYLMIIGYYANSKRRTENKLGKRKRDRDLLNLD